MKNYLQLKEDINGLSSVSNTIKAVEKIASSSIHLFKSKVTNTSNYVNTIEYILQRLSVFYDNKNHILLKPNQNGQNVVVVICGDRGLVGGLWQKVINQALELIDKDTLIIAVGEKAINLLNEEKIQIYKTFSNLDITKSNTEQEKSLIEYETYLEKSKVISKFILGKYTQEMFSNVKVIYPQFVSYTVQQPSVMQFLPFNFNIDQNQIKNAYGIPIYEPNKQQIFEKLLNKYIDLYFSKLMIETKLSELIAKTLEMENATAKAKELIKQKRINLIRKKHLDITEKQLANFSVSKRL